MFQNNSTYFFCKPNIPRGLEAKILQQQSIQFSLKGKLQNSVEQAYSEALKTADKDNLIFIVESTFVIV